jgi:hypothetical protein
VDEKNPDLERLQGLLALADSKVSSALQPGLNHLRKKRISTGTDKLGELAEG